MGTGLVVSKVPEASLDKAIVAEYKDFIKRHEVAADGIVADPDLAAEFAEGVAKRLCGVLLCAAEITG